MVLRDLVEVSEKVRSTTRMKEKVALLADCLTQARGKEIALAASYLSGQLPQGRLGIGWATLQEALRDLVEQPQSLSLREMDRLYGEIIRAKGAGSLDKKVKLLLDLFARGYPGGLALRFARVRHYRDDKSPLEVDTIQKVQSIFESRRR